jgi:hypothetical protein
MTFILRNDIGDLNMKRTMKVTAQAGSYLAFFLALAAFALPAQAHEFRAFGRYAVQLGTHIEPTFVGVPNGIDFFGFYDTTGNGDYVLLDRTQGDTVTISVVPIRVKTDVYKAPFVEADEGVFTNFKQGIIEGDIGYTAFGFKPDADDVGNTGPGTGYLGYYLTAYLKKAGAPAKTIILEKFVCENGSLDLTQPGGISNPLNTYFACVNP